MNRPAQAQGTAQPVRSPEATLPGAPLPLVPRPRPNRKARYQLFHQLSRAERMAARRRSGAWMR